ncbi:MAG: prephenate dehydratase [Blautia sp.]|nr:prephenate dehydratase [Blautia sp.]
MIDLAISREKIDSIDRQILQLFEERMQVCEAVAEYKIETGKQVLDPERERSKIETLQNLAHGEFNRLGTQELFRQIMAISRKRQYQLLTQKGIEWENSFREIEALKKTDIQVVYQGVEGAYSHAAMRRFFGKDVSSHSVKTWRQAMEAVAKKSADYAVLPIENSTVGVVAEVYDLMTEFQLYILGEQIISIQHVLLGTKAARLEDIKKVISHQQALSQCRKYLETHPDWQEQVMENTAYSAKMVRDMGDASIAAIASAGAGELYGLQVLEENLCANQQNSTRFLIIGKEPLVEKDADKISICFELPHAAGSLYSMLSHIIYNGLNMTKIESRPIPGKNWEYRFYVDFMGNISDSAVVNALRGLEAEANMLHVFGNYKNQEVIGEV